jgi:pimeloyl-ACP methyl ester carboxylesterase
VTTAQSQDRFCWTADSVRMHYRDHPGDESRPTILCLPGLTRNLKDFDALASHLAPRNRVVATSLRGRGESSYARDPFTYVPLIYVQDVQTLMDESGLRRVILLGTSLGGLIAMLLGGIAAERFAGLILNDIGPEIEAAGLRRIQQQVGRGSGWPSWLHAARDLAARQALVYPAWTLEDWLMHAKRLCRISKEGRIVWDYDGRIAEPMGLPQTDAALDLWQAFDRHAARPLLSLRGELSDILSAQTQAKMQARAPAMVRAVVPGAGHAPTLLEPAALSAIQVFLESAG